MTIREEFEAVFPTPEYLTFSERHKQYIWNGEEINIFEAAEYSYRWQGWSQAAERYKIAPIPKKEELRKILAALIDTAQRQTDLENVYNDTTGESFSWEEVLAAEKALRPPDPRAEMWSKQLVLSFKNVLEKINNA